MNHLTWLDLHSNPNLTDFYVQGNQITQLDLSAYPKLVELVEKTKKKAEDHPFFGHYDAYESNDMGCWM